MQDYNEAVLSFSSASLFIACGALLLSAGDKMTTLPVAWYTIAAAGCFLAALFIVGYQFMRGYYNHRNQKEKPKDVVNECKQVYKTTEPITKKSALIGLGVIAALIIGIAILKRGEDDATKEEDTTEENKEN